MLIIRGLGAESPDNFLYLCHAGARVPWAAAVATWAAAVVTWASLVAALKPKHRKLGLQWPNTPQH